jgi:hypothetical protein
MVYIIERIIICKHVHLMTEIKAIESGQKDALLRSANICKKKHAQ